MEKFDYIIMNEDNEWLSTGKGATKKEFEADLKEIKKREFDRWGESTGLVVFKASKMESYTTLTK